MGSHRYCMGPSKPATRAKPGNQHGPEAGEEVTEVLTHADARVLVERLENDGDRLTGGWARCRSEVGVSQVRNQKRPANQAEELYHPGNDSEGGCNRHIRRVLACQDLVPQDC